MNDPILKKAMEKREEALREAERWETWIKAYQELSDPAGESLDIPMVRRTPAPAETSGRADAELAFRSAATVTEIGNGKAVWPRGDAPIGPG